MNRFIVFIGVVLGVAGIGFGQAGQTSPDRGSKLGHAYSVGEFDTVNTTNGNLMFNFPLAGLPAGRGGATAGLNLLYNSKLYNSRVQKFRDMRYSCDPEENGPENCRYYYKTLIEPSDKGGWQLGHSYTLEAEDRLASYGANMPSCRSYGAPNALWPEMTYIHKLWIVFPDGSRHEMHPQGYTDYSGLLDKYYRVRSDGVIEDCGGSQTRTGHAMSYYSDDGSNLRMDFSYDQDTNPANNTWTLYFPDGSKVTSGAEQSGAAHRVYDRNGNYVTGLTDQFGRSVSSAYDTNGDLLVTNKGFNGANLVWRIKWNSIVVRKTYQSCVDDYTCPPEELRSDLEVQWPVVDTITEPSQMGGRIYTFSYNGHPVPNTPSGLSHGWGEISGVDLPTGAEIAYAYAMDGEDGSTDFNLTKDILKNHPTTKTLTHDGEVDTWTYSTGLTEGNSYGPDGSGAKNYFTSTEENSWLAGLTYKTEFKNGTDDIRKVEKIWAKNRNSSACDTFPARYACNPYVKTEFTSIKSGGSYTLTSIKDFTYDKNGNVTEVREYDWMPYSLVTRTFDQPDGVPAGASSYLKRKTLTAYYNDTPEASTDSYNDPDSYYLNSNKRLLRLPKSVEVQDASGTPKSRSEFDYDYENYDSSNTKAGNLTETKTWDSFKGGTSRAHSNPLTPTNSISTFATYNQYGMPTQTTDANNVVSTITYGLVGGYYDLYPTQTVTASGTGVARTSTAAYDFYSGLVTSTTDADNNVSTVMEYDSVGRTTKVRSAANTVLETWTTSDYHDTARRVIVKSDLESLGDGKKVAIQHYDQLGRVRLSRTLENAASEDPTNESHGIKVEKKYETETGYTYQATSNPYRTTSDPTFGWTRSKSWSTGIKQEVESFSGSSLPYPWGSNSSSTGIVSTDLDANRTLVTDQAGKQRISKTNGLGQMTDVWEIKAYDSSTVAVTFPGTSIGYGYQTSYGYNTLNNLLTVAQGVQTRSFTYSSLSRLLSAANPESGTVNYVYDSNGNLTRKTDARSIQSNYLYDQLNRVTQRSYANDPAYTPTVTYTYDNLTNAKGRLTKVASSVSTTEYTAFDILGRVTAHKQTTDGVTYGDGVSTSPMTYKYNLAGALIEQQYPSGRVVKNVLETDGDLSLVQSKKNANSGYWSYANNFTYNAAGTVTSMQLGNGKWESTQFNSRLQATQIAVGTVQNGTDKLDLDYTYGTTANNGNVQSQTITVPGMTYALIQSYAYDSLNRLSSATETSNSSQTWKQAFTFDRYGNRNFDQSQTTFPSFSNPNVTNPSINTANNRFNSGQGYSYDSAGNVTADAEGRTFVYDAENKQTSVSASGSTGGQYWFDGDGKRVKKYVPASGETTVFVYDAGGKLVAEYSTNVIPAQDAKVQYLTNDNLGTPRINTDADGNVTSRTDYMPYGEEIIALGNRASTEKYVADTVRQGFTGYINDEETDLDYAQARMYSNRLGRFSSADPVVMFKLSLSPQLWNKYAYAQNNPIIMVDITGEFPYTIYVRSFAPPGAFRGSGFNDDGRGFSTDTDTAKSKVQQQITIDAAAGNWGNHRVESSQSNWNGVYYATEKPIGRVTESDFRSGNGVAAAAVSTEYSALNPITAKVSTTLTPAIDVQSTIAIAENSKTGQVLVSVNITGDRFPATESFIADQKGNKVFIVGANAYGNPANGLRGNSKLPVASASLLINTDKKGTFTGVVYGGKTYSVDAWNKNALASEVQIEARKNQRCNCN